MYDPIVEQDLKTEYFSDYWDVYPEVWKIPHFSPTLSGERVAGRGGTTRVYLN